MEQLVLFEPSHSDLEKKILQLEASQEKTRKSLYAKMGAMAKDYEFLYDNLEMIKDFVELARMMIEKEEDNAIRKIV